MLKKVFTCFAELREKAQITGRSHRLGMTKGAVGEKFSERWALGTCLGYPRNLASRRSGFACQRWSGEGAWVAFS